MSPTSVGVRRISRPPRWAPSLRPPHRTRTPGAPPCRSARHGRALSHAARSRVARAAIVIPGASGEGGV